MTNYNVLKVAKVVPYSMEVVIGAANSASQLIGHIPGDSGYEHEH